MSSNKQEPVEAHAAQDLKTVITHDEVDTKKDDGAVQGDYSGAAEKSDPAEIALVRKLDLRIMVR